jgi:hypothetical protein
MHCIRELMLGFLASFAHAIEVDIHGFASPHGVEGSPNGREQYAQTLGVLLLRVCDVPKQLPDTLMHGMLRQRLKLKELDEELDERKTSPLGFLRGIVLVAVSRGLSTFQILGDVLHSGLLRVPVTLEVLLTTIEKVFAEELAASDWLAIGVGDSIVLSVCAELIHHLPAQPRVHLQPRRLANRLLDHELDNLNDRPAITLSLGLVRPTDDDLVRDTLELVDSKLVEQRFDSALDTGPRHGLGFFKTSELGWVTSWCRVNSAFLSVVDFRETTSDTKLATACNGPFLGLITREGRLGVHSERLQSQLLRTYVVRGYGT